MSGSRRYVEFRSARVLLAVAWLGLAGCATARMVPPRDVAERSDVFEATDRSSMSGSMVDESFVLGPYRVTGVDRDWDSGGVTTRGAYSREELQTAYVYQLQEGGETLAGECVLLTTRSAYDLGKVRQTSQDSSLECTCGGAAGPVKLALRLGEEGKPTGQVTLARGPIDLTSEHDIGAAWKVAVPAGYRVGKKGEPPLGAVEVLHPGRVWLSRDLDPLQRRQLACLLTGLLLHVEPSGESAL